MNQYHAIKPGDRVTRMLGGTVPMTLKVSNITERTIECGPWVFNRDTGMEIDLDMGWDGIRKTGSYLRPPKNHETPSA